MQLRSILLKVLEGELKESNQDYGLSTELLHLVKKIKMKRQF